MLYLHVQEFGNIESPIYSRLRHFFATIYSRFNLSLFILSFFLLRIFILYKNLFLSS